MNDDFSVPKALAEIHVAVREGNKALSASDEQTAQKLAESVRRMAELLGFDPLSNQWGASESDDSAALEALDVLVQAELARRAQARAEKNWAVADEVRGRLAEAGITVTDSGGGAKWPRHCTPIREKHTMARTHGRGGAGPRKTNKKGAVKGTGGQRRKGLEGKGPTPKAEDRVYHAKHKAKLQRQRRDSGRHEKETAEMVVGRNPV